MITSIISTLSENFKSVLFTIACLIYANISIGQNILWADKVLKVSSEAGTKAYSAKQILGKPNATPDSAGNAWRPNSQGKPETIELGFSQPFKAKQLLIVEALTPGFIRSVTVKNAEGIEFPVASYGSKSAIKGPRLLTIDLTDYSIQVASVSITLIPVRDVSVTIDAVGLTDSDQNFKLVNYINLEAVSKAAPVIKADTAVAVPEEKQDDKKKKDKKKK